MRVPIGLPCFAAAVFLLGYVRSKNPDDIRITGFEPNSGPTSGGTTIRIEGRHFRSLFTEETADLQVKIGKSKLVVLSWQDDLIICRTEETSIEISSPIRVHFLPKPVTCPVYVSCKTPDKQIRQTTKHFELLKPNLVSFEPRITIGQRGKEINIVIIGKNLNIGNVRNATLWSGDCVEQTNDGSVMICKLQSFWDPKDMSETDRNTITVRIDGWTATLLGKVDGFIEIFGDYQKLLKKEGRSAGKILLILAIVVLTLIPVTIAIVYIIRRMIRDKADAASEHLSMGAIKPRDQPVYQSTVESRSEPVYQNTAGQTSERVSLMKAIDDADIASLQDVGKIIAMEHLTLKQEIGQGHFGTVFKGRLYDSKRDRTMDVAVKTVHEKGADAREISAFFQEALIMRDFEHPNILSLIGVAFTKDGMPLVVIPFMFNGNLRTYIRDVRIPPRFCDLMRMATDIANGMSYLEFNKVVHRDLAARNCLLDDHLNVRVSDFGLSRDVYQRDYYRASKTATDMPVRWMAPECIEFHQFSSKSDVWSYGVLVWELMTRGKIPYATVNTWEIATVLKCGIRLEKPDSCPDFLYKLMMRCWSRDPDERPNFADLVKLITAGVQKMEVETDSESKHTEGEYENGTQ